MLDIRFVRENAELVKEACRRRFKPMDEVVDELVDIDAQRRKLNAKTDDLKAQQNRASKQIPVMKKNGEDTTELMAQMKEIFAERLKELRMEKELGQEALAQELGLSHGIISLWENGLREPKMSNLVLLAKYFDVTIDYLVGLED